MKLITGIALLALCTSIACLVMVMKPAQKIVFCNIEDVYNEFTMKKELEKQFDHVAQMRENILDSLKLDLEILSKRITSKNDEANIRLFQMKRESYLVKQQEFSQSTQQTNEQYKNQIWKQLSQYIRQYGKENNCTYILGFENKTSVLYGDEAKDITKELSSYVNDMYKGGAK